MISKRHRYYIAVIKKGRKILITLTKTAISEFVGMSHDTITRHMKHSSVYETDSFIIWKNIPIETLKRGFALKRYYKDAFR